jgi:hypothetical protein
MNISGGYVSPTTAIAQSLLEAEAAAGAWISKHGRRSMPAEIRELVARVDALRALHRQLSPCGPGTLAGIGDPARRSNFGNVGEPME